MFVRTSTWRVKEGKRREAVALLKELVEILHLPYPMRVFVPETGDRGEIVLFGESEDVAALFNRDRNRDPGEAATWFAKWNEVTVPGSWREQIWQEV